MVAEAIQQTRKKLGQSRPRLGRGGVNTAPAFYCGIPVDKYFYKLGKSERNPRERVFARAITTRWQQPTAPRANKLNTMKSKKQFNPEQILDSASIGKFPVGMTAKDLLGVRAKSRFYGHETCLHIAARNGKLPKGTSINDLLEMREGTHCRPLLTLIQSRNPRLPLDITAQDLKKIKLNRMGTFLHLAAGRGVLPQGTTIADLISVRNKEGKTPLHYAAIYGYLIQCTKAELSRVIDSGGKSPWNYAVETLDAKGIEKPYWNWERPFRNIIACPHLASKLRPDKIEFHWEIILKLLRRKLTPELREQLAKHPKACAEML